MKIKYVLAAVNDKSSLMKCSHKETRTFMHISLRNKKNNAKGKIKVGRIPSLFR